MIPKKLDDGWDACMLKNTTMPVNCVYLTIADPNNKRRAYTFTFNAYTKDLMELDVVFQRRCRTRTYIGQTALRLYETHIAPHSLDNLDQLYIRAYEVCCGTH